MAVRHISGVGSNTNDGTTKSTAWRTIQYALSQITEDSTIIVHKGTYTAFGTMPNYNMRFIGVDENRFDAAGAANMFSGPSNKQLRFWNLEFFNWSTGAFNGGTYINSWYYNCIMAKTGSQYQLNGTNYSGNYSFAYLGNCTLFGISGFQRPAVGGTGFYLNNCIIAKCVNNPCRYGTMRHCSVELIPDAYYDYTGCFAGATYPPPFVSVNSANPDLRFDSGHAQFAKYMSGGEGGCPIGAIRGLGSSGAKRTTSHAVWVFPMYNVAADDDMDQASNLGAWANNENYFNTSFDPVTITTGVNDKIDFDDGEGTHTATLAAGTYSSGASLATEVQTKMNAVSSDVFVTYLSGNGHLQIRTGGTSLNLLWNTGPNKATSACASLGFVDTADDTGYLAYTSDNHLLVGGASPGYAPAVWNDDVRRWQINTEVVPEGSTAEVVSPVVDGYALRQLKYAFSQKNLVGYGSMTFKYRGDAASFGQQDAAGTTDVDWTSLTEGTEITANNSFLYTQAKVGLSTVYM